MLGLRRFRGVQIDLWQGDVTRFVGDALLMFEVENSSEIHERPAGPKMMVTSTISLPLPSDQAVTTDWLKLKLKQVLDMAEKRSLRHLLIPSQPDVLSKQPEINLLIKGMFQSLRDWLKDNSNPKLGRVTFVANNPAAYNTLQEFLFSEFADELNEEGF